MTELAVYMDQFAHLRRAPGAIWTDATKNHAPHKPILLFAVMDVIARGAITSPFIAVTEDLVELNELFNLYWRRIISLGQTSSIAFPFTRLHNEPFWKLVPLPGRVLSASVINGVTSVSQLRTLALGARMDDDLFHYLNHPESRASLREVLLRACFSMQARDLLLEQTSINADAYHYSLELEHEARLPFVKETLVGYNYKPEVRDQAFRRIVVTTYDHRCALCGIRIVTPDGHTVVEAAHIVPWSKSRNDDVRNGMALCRLCHWGFDEGMLGVSDNYTVITSRSIGVDPNFPGLLQTLSGRSIIPPIELDLWPEQQYLAAHRKEWHL